jgi:hypothetical protein
MINWGTNESRPMMMLDIADEATATGDTVLSQHQQRLNHTQVYYDDEEELREFTDDRDTYASQKGKMSN